MRKKYKELIMRNAGLIEQLKCCIEDGHYYKNEGFYRDYEGKIKITRKCLRCGHTKNETATTAEAKAAELLQQV